MFSVPDFLDRAKRGAKVESDYGLAKVTGLGRANISNYRNGKTAPDGRAVMALCALSGDDPEHVAACIQSMRAANNDEAALWQRVADRLRQGGAASVAMALAVAGILLSSLYGTPVLADGTMPPSVYYVELAVAVRILWRLRCSRVFTYALQRLAAHPLTIARPQP